MGVVMERWCPTQQMLGVFLKENKREETTFSWNYCAADGNISIGPICHAPRIYHR
jgi:hypothetical protein